MPEERNVIDLVRVAKKFGNHLVVQDLSLSVPKGEIFGFIGPSGSGKTTTIRLLTGIYAPDDGLVRVLGRNPKDFRRREREELGYVPQLFVLYPNLTVQENVNFAASLYGLSWLRRRRRVKDVLQFVEILDARKRLAVNLSGGMLRRLQLAAALVHRPSLLFIDEPTAGIDPILREKFWQGFRQLRDEGSTLFITTQYVSESEYCDHVGLMNQGTLAALGTPAELRREAMGGEVIEVKFSRPFFLDEDLSKVVHGIRRVEQLSPTELRIYSQEAASTLPPLLDHLANRGAEIASAHEYRPSFDEVFARLIRRTGRQHEDQEREKRAA